VASGVRTFRPGTDRDAIVTIMDASLATDRPPGTTRQDLLHNLDRMVGDPTGTVVALEDGEVVGYCVPRLDDLTVHPDHRRRGHGQRLVTAARQLVRDRGQDDLILYGSLEHPAAAAFIDALGFRYHSSLWQFELARSVPVPVAAFPADVVTRTYRSDDLDTVVDVMNAAFADHPSPLTFDRATVAHINSLPDFEPEGILLVFPEDQRETLIAWARTLHETRENGEHRGFVNTIGVLPAWRGRGLGRELLRWSIARLRAVGAETIELSVEAANERALGLYRRTGFEPRVEWPHWSVPTSDG
jgi:mycothiol synthase